MGARDGATAGTGAGVGGAEIGRLVAAGLGVMDAAAGVGCGAGDGEGFDGVLVGTSATGSDRRGGSCLGRFGVGPTCRCVVRLPPIPRTSGGTATRAATRTMAAKAAVATGRQ